MIETERELSSLVHGHFMLILAPHLGETTNTLMDPLVTVDLLLSDDRQGSTIRHGYRGTRVTLGHDGVNSGLKTMLEGAATFTNGNKRVGKVDERFLPGWHWNQCYQNPKLLS